MASPYAAGLLALLRSAAGEEQAPNARSLKQALMVTARPLTGRHLSRPGHRPAGHRRGLVVAQRRSRHARGAGPRRRRRRCERRATAHSRPPPTRRSASGWSVPPASAPIASPSGATAPGSSPRRRCSCAAGVTEVGLRYRTEQLRAPGAHVGVVTGWGPDTLAGPLFRLVNTVIVLVPADTSSGRSRSMPAARAGVLRGGLGRPFAVRVASDDDGPTLLGALFTPGGRPGLDENILGAGPAAPAEFVVDASDTRTGVWEADALGSPVAAGYRHRHRPDLVGAHRPEARLEGRGACARQPREDRRRPSGRCGARRRAARGAGAGPGSRAEEVPFTAPAWARELVIDADMPRDDVVALHRLRRGALRPVGPHRGQRADELRRRAASAPSSPRRWRARRSRSGWCPAFGDTTAAGVWKLNVADPPVRRRAGAARRERRRGGRSLRLTPDAHGRGTLPDGGTALADARRVLPARPGGRDGRGPSMDPRGRTPGPDGPVMR